MWVGTNEVSSDVKITFSNGWNVIVKAKQMSEGKKFCWQTMTHTTLCHFGSSDCGVGH